ncbi:hypothetical protein ACEQPO_12335 [Bacillus sp. SL00103]
MTEKPVEKAIQLEPFIGFAGEIGYDDGTAENAREPSYDPGCEVSYQKREETTLTGGLFRF